MNKYKAELSTNCLYAAFHADLTDQRRHWNFEASKSMTRFTVLLSLTFMVAWFNFYIQ